MEVGAILSLNRQIKKRKVLSPPALPARAADYCGTRENSCRELFPKDPTEVVSHTEQCPRYSHAAASSCRGPGGPGGRELSIQAAWNTSSPAAAPAASREPTCTCGEEANATHSVCAGWFSGDWFTFLFLRKCLSSDSFLFVLVTNKTSADDLSLPPISLGFLLGEELIQKVEIDETSFSPYLPLIQRAHSPCSLTSLQALFARCCSL